MQDWISELSSPVPTRRHAAAVALRERGELSAGPALLKALGNLQFPDDYECSLALLEGLFRLRPEGLANAVVDLLSRWPSVGTFRAGCEILRELDDRSVLPSLEAMFRDEEAESQTLLIAPTIAAIGDRETVARWLWEFVRDDDDWRRLAALRTLGELRWEPAAPHLRELARTEEDEELRHGALEALLAMNDADAPMLLRLESEGARSVADKMSLLELVAAAGTVELTDWIFERSADPQWCTDPSASQTRDLRLETLAVAAKLGHVRATETLWSVVHDPAASPCSSGTAASILVDLGERGAVELAVGFMLRARGDRERDPRDPCMRADYMEERLIGSLTASPDCMGARDDIVNLLKSICGGGLGHGDRTRRIARDALEQIDLRDD